MDEKVTSNVKHRIPGRAAVPGQGSNPFANPGQNVGFSDGFLTKSPVDACHSGQPGETTDPQNPMKSKDDPQSKGLPPVPPLQVFTRLVAFRCRQVTPIREG